MAEYTLALETMQSVSWLDKITNLFESDQEEEEYAWLGMPPAFREWLGERLAKKLRDDGITIKNLEFESTIEILVKHLRRANGDKLRARIREHVQRAFTHWASLTTQVILDGATTTAYDGQYYFDTDHVVGDSGTQSNKIDVDISTLPVTTAGSTTAPSPAAILQAIIQGIDAICSFNDDQGEPMNEMAEKFLVMVPNSLYAPARTGITMPRGTDIEEQVSDKDIELVRNTRLGAWTDKFAVFRTDGEIKPIIRQQEVGVEVSAVAEGSEYEFFNKKHQYGLYASRNVAPGRWEQACQGVVLGLTDEQAADRSHQLGDAVKCSELPKGVTAFLTTAQTSFKKGEEIYVDETLPKTLARGFVFQSEESGTASKDGEQMPQFDKWDRDELVKYLEDQEADFNPRSQEKTLTKKAIEDPYADPIPVILDFDVDVISEESNLSMKTHIAEAVRRKVATQASRSARDQYNVTARRIAQDLKFGMRQNNTEASIEWHGNRISLIHFSAAFRNINTSAGKRIGATVRIHKGKKRMIVKGGFIASGSNANVQIFKRRGIGRLPISSLKGPSVPQMIENRATHMDVEKLVSQEYPAIFANKVPEFSTVGHAWTINPVEKLKDAMPVAYVFAGDETFGDQADDLITAKMMTERIVVYIVCENADLSDRKSDVRTAAIGWSPGAAYTDLAPVSGRLIDIKGSAYWWEYVFETRIKISSA
ncbi:unnamed protein product [Symbiodinium microadriaticum]|nr:unnamed protein product [Symbiodinium microadriaticum]